MPVRLVPQTRARVAMDSAGPAWALPSFRPRTCMKPMSNHSIQRMIAEAINSTLRLGQNLTPTERADDGSYQNFAAGGRDFTAPVLQLGFGDGVKLITFTQRRPVQPVRLVEDDFMGLGFARRTF